MNCYATLQDLKDVLHITAAVRDAELMRVIESASREIEGPAYANRVFSVCDGVRYFDPPVGGYLFLDDIVEITELAIDGDEDGTYSEILAEHVDYELQPYNGWPKTIIAKCEGSSVTWPTVRRSVRVTGTWGYAESATPWRATAVTASLTSTQTTIVLAGAADLVAGQTIQVGDEQIFVESVVTAESVTTATLRRGVNATLAAACGLDSATIAFDEIEAETTVTICGVTFTAHATTTTAADREFSIGTSDSDAATELAGLINDGTYGVEGVTAVADGATIAISVDDVDPVDPVDRVYIEAEASEDTVTIALDGAVVSLMVYPADVVQGCVWFAVAQLRGQITAGAIQERIGDYFFAAALPEVTEKQKKNMSWRVRRHGA